MYLFLTSYNIAYPQGCREPNDSMPAHVEVSSFCICRSSIMFHWVQSQAFFIRESFIMFRRVLIAINFRATVFHVT